ncbi:MAG: hypothetical protein M3Z19_02010, partial [Chloroflexota bacterium]|nr:hypothetical protein [Chloroflexota bacterium]
PNVFYELGIAHAHSKEVILVTGDPISEAPSDVRHFEFICYEMDKHVEFFDRLDNALRNVFRERYEGLFKSATSIFREFRAATHANVVPVDKDVFIQRVVESEQTRELPDPSDEQAVTEFVLPKIIAQNSDLDTMRVITKWIAQKFEGVTSRWTEQQT